MSQGSASSTADDYLVSALEADVLAQVIALIEADRSFKLLRRMGPVNKPHTLLVSMDEDHAALLMQRFPDQLLVERDRPLSMYGASQDTSAHE